MYPCLLSAMRGPTGIITAVHMTFLDPLQPKKLSADGEDESAKIMFGEARGAMMRVSGAGQAMMKPWRSMPC